MSSDNPDIYPSQEQALIGKLRENIETVIRSNNQSIKWLLTSFFSGGHVLLEDVPGTGKPRWQKHRPAPSTPLSSASSSPRISGLRISSVCPSMTSRHRTSVFVRARFLRRFCWQMKSTGPHPEHNLRYWSAMTEQQVSIEGDRFAMDELFSVIATQNPVEFHGTDPERVTYSRFLRT